MITVFPALTSSTVNPNALPGIVKALEKFVVVYRMDGIISAASGLQRAGKAKMLLAGTRYETEDSILTEYETSPVKVGPTQKDWEEIEKIRKQEATRKERELDKLKKEVEYEESKEKVRHDLSKKLEKYKADLRVKGTEDQEILKKQLDIVAQDLNKHVEINVPRFDAAVSVEPTFVQVDRPFFGSTIVGVKVIPFQVKSDRRLIELISHDRIAYGLERLLLTTKRGAVSLFRGALNKLKVPFLSGGTVTGDVRKDVLYASSAHWKNTFVILNYMDLASDEFTNSPEGIRKLHTMGWSSLIFADDVNKRAIFCMKEYNGLCSTVMYPYLFSSLGGEHAKIYKDLEDVKASASPIFKTSTSLSKLSRLSAKRGEEVEYTGRL